MISFTNVVLPALALSSMVLNAWQWIAGRRFPVGKRVSTSGFQPPLSILKPLKGRDAETERCLESWFRQDYPAERELFFGIADANDPVREIVRRLMEKYPALKCELIVCQPLLGPNAKVSSLCHLAKQARFEHLVVSDADVEIPPDFLLNLVAPFERPSTGLVSCFYILAEAKSLATRWEAMAVNADFWTQVLQGNMIRPMNFALGAVMAATRDRLESIGGFASLLGFLADDYQLGNRIAKTGAKLELCPVPVTCRSAPQGWKQVWDHQLRWARTIRVCQPLPYFFSILSNATLWPLLCAPWTPKLAAAALLLRISTAQLNYRRLTGAFSPAAWLAPVKDLLQAAIWLLSFLGDKITWRGERFRVDRSGKLTPLA